MPYFISLTFASSVILLLFCAVYVLLLDRRAVMNRVLALFCLLLAIANTGEMLAFLSPSLELFRLWYRLSWFGWSLYPATALHFALLFASLPSFTRHQRSWPLLYLPGLVFLVRSQFSLVGIRDFTLTELGTYLPMHAYGPWDVAYPIYQYLFDLLALFFIVYITVVSPSRRRKRLALVIVSCALVSIGIDIFRYFAGANGELSVLWPLEEIIFISGMIYAVTMIKLTVPTTSMVAHYIAEHVKDLVVLTTPDCLVLYANQAALSMLNAHETVLVGRPFQRFIRDASLDPASWPGDAGQGDASMECEVNLQPCQGEPVPVWLTCAGIRDQYRDLIGFILVGEDLRYTRELREEVLERYKAEEALRESDKAKDMFLATVSHEMLTPLTAMQLWIRLAQRDAAQVPKALEVIEDNIKQQQHIVRDLLDISRILHGQVTLEPGPIELSALVAQCVEEYRRKAEERQVTLTLSTNGPVRLRGDELRLRQVFANLLLNALKFTPDGGTVTVSVTTRADHALIILQDTGCGILADDLPQIFQPFRQGLQTVAAGGLGLGLTVAHGIVELHHGTLTAESPGVNQGSTFTVLLPCAAATRDNPVPASSD